MITNRDRTNYLVLTGVCYIYVFAHTMYFVHISNFHIDFVIFHFVKGPEVLHPGMHHLVV